MNHIPLNLFDQYEPFDAYRHGSVVGMMQSAIDLLRTELQDKNEIIADLHTWLQECFAAIASKDAEIERMIAILDAIECAECGAKSLLKCTCPDGYLGGNDGE